VLLFYSLNTMVDNSVESETARASRQGRSARCEEVRYEKAALCGERGFLDGS
jgi:hypothetical protein